MAEIIPSLNKSTLSHMTTGEKKVAHCLKSLLEDDYLCWYDIPVGKKRRYPDFIILHPGRGLLFLEVKDWKAETLRKINKKEVQLLTDSGLVTTVHPLDQARQYAYPVIDMLSHDPQLQQENGNHKGKLIVPYGWGVIFTNISRQQVEKAMPNDSREILLPDHLVIYKGEFSENNDAEFFQQRLWGMFNYQFGDKLSLPQIDRIRWHLFPEIRIGDQQADLFSETQGDISVVPVKHADNLPEIIKIMDIQQEQLARSLGEGHRIIHGVAGSGKTLILGYRCLQLSQISSKPILVLCFNISLAAKLRSFISAKGIDGQVQVYHFHGWCAEQLRIYNVDLLKSKSEYWVRQVDSVIVAVDKGLIPRAQYGALLIDEGHDFKAEWLKLVMQMIDPKNNSLLLLYDDAQSIYKKHSRLGFSFSSVGIQAQGRTTILKLNYRNTREILNFAYEFAHIYINPYGADDDHIPLIEPQAAGIHGDVPEVHQFSSFNSEVDFTLSCLQEWREQGVPWNDMAVLYVSRFQGRAMAEHLEQAEIPHLWMGTKRHKAAYDVTVDQVTVLTVHSSKGLEFPYVVIIGMGGFPDDKEKLQEGAGLLYVGMTRAQKSLLLTTSKNNELSRRVLTVANG